ncbi:hypothetical protein J27TS8_13000 [Robertmurraya siralis]|uniref:Aminoglycoside phosphotransferase domain-containing protein n=1 Tax=Robertmurraya siralis TaxID=77777 RepID=A0A919WGF2_9BACI|nr:phosphotransferase [Robertmurraya siralis]PAE19007.1 hypothetical protein CHH80_18770 [Bacillus sp. 7504-2]GIN61307.1 hypothetical protein J27TS8_13000 [Robertmurraya siralis]
MEKRVADVFTDEIMKTAFQQFSIQKEMQKLGDFENYVYEVVKNKQSYILRLTHSSHRSQESICSELDWINYLHNCGMNVPKVYETVKGKLVAAIRARDGSYFFGSLFSKAPGSPVKVNDENFSKKLFYQWGSTIGKIHSATKEYHRGEGVKERLHWNEDELLAIERYIPKEEELVISNAKKLIANIERLERTADQYGLIHSDLHQGNFFYDGKDIHVFDFDDCCFHWFCSDIAIPIYYATLFRYPDNKKGERDAFASIFLESFIAGYTTENNLPDDWIKQVLLFLRLRDVTLYSVFHKKIATEDRSERVKALLKEIRARIERNEPLIKL